MTFKKGQSGNPKGRPPKGRAMADLLRQAFDQDVTTPKGKVKAKELLARQVMEAVTTGTIQFPGDKEPSTIGVREWLELVKWAHQYLDPTPTKSELSGPDGESIQVVLMVPANGRNPGMPEWE